MDPRTPVIVGANQRNWRDAGNEPIDVMATTAEELFSGDGALGRLRAQLSSVRVVGGIWPYKDPGSLIAERLGARDVETTMTYIGGNEVYDLVATTAADLQRGDIDVALLCSAETMRTRRAESAAGRRFAYLDEADDAAPDHQWGSKRSLAGPAQQAVGADEPVLFYALAENAMAHQRGWDSSEHCRRIGELWARASQVAATNPDAWLPREYSPEELSEVSESNRMVATPYTKLLTSNVNVDQSAAVVMCTYQAAAEAGVEPSAMVFPHAGAGAADHWTVRERWNVAASPAMRIAGFRALELAGWSVGDLEDLDLYSCFPIAVQVAQDELGIDRSRPFTITGGLTFAGGPLNSYCMHALVTATDRIRDGRSARTFLTGNGGYLTKHSFICLAPDAPTQGFRADRPQRLVDAEPARPIESYTATAGTIEGHTVQYDRDNTPAALVATVIDTAGARRWARTTNPDWLTAASSGDLGGTEARLAPTATRGVVELLAP